MKRRMVAGFLTTVLVVAFSFVSPFSWAAEKKLVVAIGQEPLTMDHSLMATSPDYVVLENWAEYLVGRQQNGELGPGLADSWKVSPDGMTIEFTLRKGVKFHSGDPVTTKDVQFSFERQLAKNILIRTRLKSFDRLEVIDDYRFTVYLKSPDVTFIPNRVIPLVSKDYYDRVGEDKFSRNPVGTGPYKFVRHAPGEYVDIERFEDYWGQKPSVKEARFLFVPEDTTRVAKLKTGEVDFIGNCPYPAVKDIEKSPNLKVVKYNGYHPAPSIIFANRNPKVPWHDTRVRLAMAYAIDCDAIIKNTLLGIPNRLPFLAPHEIGYDPNLKPYPYDPKKAKELLAEAGYPKGFDFKLYWQITGFPPMMREVIEAVASYWAAVDIRAQLVGEEYASVIKRRRASKGPEADFVAFTGPGRANAPDPSYYLDLFFGADGAMSVYYNPELDKITAQAKATIDNEKRAELIRKGTWIVHNEAASIPIYCHVYCFGMKKNIDFKPTQRIIQDLILVKDVTIN